MKIPLLFCVLLGCAAVSSAQPDLNAAGNYTPIIVPKMPPFELPLVAPNVVVKALIPKPIALHLRDVTLAEALQQLKTESGVEFDIGGEKQPETLAKKLSLDLETVGFDAAFDQIMRAAGARGFLQNNGTNAPERVYYEDVDPYQFLPRDERGLFVARLRRLNSTLSETVDLNEKPAPTRKERNFLNIFLWTWPDLRLPITREPRVRITRAQDDKGRSLLIEDGEPATFDLSGPTRRGARSTMQEPVAVARPAPDARRLAHLEGVVTWVVPLQTERWEEADLLATPQLRHQFESNGQQIVLTLYSGMSKSELISLRIQADVPATLIEDKTPNPLFNKEQLIKSFYLEDAEGYLLRGRDGEGSFTPDRTQFNAYTRPQLTGERNPAFVTPESPTEKPGQHKIALPVKWVFEAPKNWVKTEVPFAFSDLPLPQIQ